MKQALCLQHVSFEGPGAFRPALEKRQYQLDTLLVPERDLPATLPDFLLVMGGPMSVNDADPWIERELQFIRRAIEAGIPVLGVCLGSQFIAKALGGQVRPGPRPEIGPVPVTRIVEEDADAVFGTFPREFTVFQWHGEGLTLPPEACVLASSEFYPVQAFRYGDRAYGLLFPSGIGTRRRRSPLPRMCHRRTTRTNHDRGLIEISGARPSRMPSPRRPPHRPFGAVVKKPAIVGITLAADPCDTFLDYGVAGTVT